MARIIIIGSSAEALIHFRGEMLRSFLNAGHEVIAVASDENPAVCAILANQGIRYVAVPMLRTGMNPLSDLAYVYRLWRLLRELKPDVLFSYTIKPVVYGMVAGSLAGVGQRFALITGLGYSFIDKPGFLWKMTHYLVRLLYGIGLYCAHDVFFQNPDDLHLFKQLRLLPKNMMPKLVNGSGLDITYYSECALPKKPIFLLIARLLHSKGVLEYVEAARKVTLDYPHAEFHLIGPFDTNPSAITQKKVDAWVEDGLILYHGEVEDVRPWIAQCSIFVLPSYREGAPRAVLEAMAMGRPVITTDAPGCRETVVDGVNGFLVPIKDASALADAMCKLAGSEALRSKMGLQGRLRACQKYDVEKINLFLLTEMRLLTTTII